MGKEDYVSLEASKLLEKKGFNEPCNAIYIESPQEGRSEFKRYITDDIKKSSGIRKIKDGCKYNEYLAPTLYSAARWLREVCDTHILIDWGWDGYDFTLVIKDVDGTFIETSYHNYYPTYEECLEEGIKAALEEL